MVAIGRASDACRSVSGREIHRRIEIRSYKTTKSAFADCDVGIHDAREIMPRRAGACP
jgi:hypothetical protein